MPSETTGSEEEIALNLLEVIQGDPEVIMSLLEFAAGQSDKALVRDIVETAFILYSGREASLPGGRAFWDRMRSEMAAQVPVPSSVDERTRRIRALEVFRGALVNFGNTNQSVRKRLDDAEKKRLAPFAPGAEGPKPPTGKPALLDDTEMVLPRRRQTPAPNTVPAKLAAFLPVPEPVVPARAAISGSVDRGVVPSPGPGSPPPRPRDAGAQEPVSSQQQPAYPCQTPQEGEMPAQKTPIAPRAGPDEPPARVEELRAIIDKKDAELRSKEQMLREYEVDMKKIYEQIKIRDALPDIKDIEDRLAIQEEETRMAKEDLARMEKKYRENIELLKGESRDRATLQKSLTTAEEELSRARLRLREVEADATDIRRELDGRETEVRRMADQIHSKELELVRKEEEIKSAMAHLREEEQERRRVLEVLRKEAREKAQMEHRLKKREAELSLLETRLTDEERHLEALKGSQAVSEETSLRRGEELRRREEDVRRLEADNREKLAKLRGEEKSLRESIRSLTDQGREREQLEVRFRKKEELLAAVETRYRTREEEALRAMVEIEKARAHISVREQEAAVREPSPPPTVIPPAPERMLRRDEILEMLSKRVVK